MGRKSIDLTGKRFGKLVAISIDHKSNSGTRVYWECACDCGGTRIVSNDHLRNGDISDCGCYRKHIAHWKKHGMYDTRLYRIWSLMKERCYNSKRKEYPNYGGRGICVCPEWHDSKSFIDWATKNGYSENLTLDRIDNDGDYCPGNCRWVNRKEQMNNRRNNHYIFYNGKKQTITQVAENNGLTYAQLHKRLKLGWSIEKAISEPISLKHSHKGVKKELKRS